MRGKVAQGDRIRWFISSANRDPNAFADPDPDIARDRTRTSPSARSPLLGQPWRVEGQEVLKALMSVPSLHVQTPVRASAQHHLPLAVPAGGLQWLARCAFRVDHHGVWATPWQVPVPAVFRLTTVSRKPSTPAGDGGENPRRRRTVRCATPSRMPRQEPACSLGVRLSGKPFHVPGVRLDGGQNRIRAGLKRPALDVHRVWSSALPPAWRAGYASP
jgi:hypothetical protein